MVDRNPDSTFGYLTVINVEGLGLCGGLLVVRPNGRPVEFHCTAPVSPNRTQEILYGKSLDSFLICEQIGSTLLKKAKAKIDIVITNEAAFHELEPPQQQPLVLILPKDQLYPETLVSRGYQFDIHAELLTGFVLSNSHSGIKKTVETTQKFDNQLPIEEPFERIQSAIEEAQAVAK